MMSWRKPSCGLPVHGFNRDVVQEKFEHDSVALWIINCVLYTPLLWKVNLLPLSSAPAAARCVLAM